MKKFVFALTLLAAPFVHAASNGKIGPAGCGLGNVVMGSDNQIFASTTSGTSGSQTFGITPGTSGCEAGNRRAKMAMFVEANRETLAIEAARGRGETVEALSSLMGCSNVAVVGETLKVNHSEIFKANGENSLGISDSIEKHVGAQATCQQQG